MKINVKLLEKNYDVIGVDSMNHYYDINLKKNRLKILKKIPSKKKFIFYKLDLTKNNLVKKIFCENKFKIVLHLAAQAGVRYSINNPNKYVHSNLNGFFNVINNSRLHKIKKFIYASSSSVYGSNKNLPFNEKDPVDHPLPLQCIQWKLQTLVPSLQPSTWLLHL